MKRLIKKFIIVLVVIGFGTFFSGCEKNFLDRQIQQNWDEQMFLNSGFNNLKALGMAVYGNLKHFNGYGSNATLATACDEADFAFATTIQRFNTGAWGPFSNPDDVYDDYYKAIRQANLFLEKTVNFKTMIIQDTLGTNKVNYYINLDDFTKLRAEVRFLRAYFHMELVKRYGGVPVITKVLSEEEAFLITRKSYDDCINFITNECDSVYPILANHWTNYGIPTGTLVGRGDAGTDNTRLGRIEKPAASALKIRALLFAASPLNNPTNDLAKWIKATNAAKDFFLDPNTAPVRFIYNNYKALFHAQIDKNTITPIKGKNTGLIMTRPFETAGNAFEKANYPIGMTGAGAGATCPSQNLVDAFEVKSTGKPISDPTSAYNPANPFNDRDPRLAFIVACNGSIYGKNIDATDRYVQTFQGGVDAVGIKYGATTTGYYLRKMCVENFDLTKNPTQPKAWVLMRYEEVLLSFAEAMNEAYGPDADQIGALKTARTAVNEIRARVGVAMPAIPLGLTKEQMRDRIRNERRVELAFEEHRFFDVRRWKIAEQTEDALLIGMKITKNSDNTLSYEKFEVEKRVFDKSKMYFYPIPQAEIQKSNGLMTQNPGW